MTTLIVLIQFYSFKEIFLSDKGYKFSSLQSFRCPIISKTRLIQRIFAQNEQNKNKTLLKLTSDMRANVRENSSRKRKSFFRNRSVCIQCPGMFPAFILRNEQLDFRARLQIKKRCLIITKIHEKKNKI